MGDVVPFRSRSPESGPVSAGQPSPAEQPLWREAVGRELRGERHAARRTLSDVAGKAGVSTQYLSEVERGLKDPSSEILEAVSGALGLRLADLTSRVTRRLAGADTGPVCRAA